MPLFTVRLTTGTSPAICLTSRCGPIAISDWEQESGARYDGFRCVGLYLRRRVPDHSGSNSEQPSGSSEPVPGRELHPLKSSAFHGALLRQLTIWDELLTEFCRHVGVVSKLLNRRDTCLVRDCDFRCDPCTTMFQKLSKCLCPVLPSAAFQHRSVASHTCLLERVRQSSRQLLHLVREHWSAAGNSGPTM